MITEQEIQSIKNRFEIIGNSPKLNRAIEVAIKVAPTDITVLITGESGVGKENFSKIIHSLSRRKHGNFIAINCGAIPSGTIDSELFGHEKGSFTSAHEARKGYFETVNGGTIFLDEIGELPLETQSRLLRVLESGEFIKVGSSKVQKTDVRIIAATNKDLLKLSHEGKFREDLYYRLSSVTIPIPPLRERQEDIPLLFMKFASDFADKYRVPPLELTPEAIHVFKSFSWPGNIRQLKNVVEQISILETSRIISGPTAADYMPEERKPGLTLSSEGSSKGGFDNYTERELLYKFLFEIKKDIGELKTIIIDILQNGNVKQEDLRHIYESNRLLTGPSSYRERHREMESPHTEPHNEFAEGEFVNGDEPSEEVLSLQDVEREMIKRALQKYSGKRKPAAEELGISERTLYRKIKEYELEETV